MWRIKLRIKVSVQLRMRIGQGRDSGRVAKGLALTLPCFLPFPLIFLSLSFSLPRPCPWLPVDRDDRCFGRDRDRFRDSERFESDWRARPAAPDTFDDFPPRRSDDGFGDSE